jgi:hypothetical protein
MNKAEKVAKATEALVAAQNSGASPDELASLRQEVAKAKGPQKRTRKK